MGVLHQKRLNTFCDVRVKLVWIPFDFLAIVDMISSVKKPMDSTNAGDIAVAKPGELLYIYRVVNKQVKAESNQATLDTSSDSLPAIRTRTWATAPCFARREAIFLNFLDRIPPFAIPQSALDVPSFMAIMAGLLIPIISQAVAEFTAPVLIRHS